MHGVRVPFKLRAIQLAMYLYLPTEPAPSCANGKGTKYDPPEQFNETVLDLSPSPLQIMESFG
jgi:hypothetical protein